MKGGEKCIFSFFLAAALIVSQALLFTLPVKLKEGRTVCLEPEVFLASRIRSVSTGFGREKRNSYVFSLLSAWHIESTMVTVLILVLCLNSRST